MGRMRLRIFLEPQQGATYEDQLAVARAAEDLGFDALFRSDHYLHMGDHVSGFPGPTDAWITLAGLARETSRIRLGTLMSAATFRHPGPLAISVAQVDRMSGGRVEFGFGAGWFEQEHAVYGIPFPATARERFDRYEEQLDIITGLWSTPAGETFRYEGRHYRLAEGPALPKPQQGPRPPVLIGGTGLKRTPRLAAKFADEYNVPFASLEDTAAAINSEYNLVAAATASAFVLNPPRSICFRRPVLGFMPTSIRNDHFALQLHFLPLHLHPRLRNEPFIDIHPPQNHISVSQLELEHDMQTVLWFLLPWEKYHMIGGMPRIRWPHVRTY